MSSFDDLKETYNFLISHHHVTTHRPSTNSHLCVLTHRPHPNRNRLVPHVLLNFLLALRHRALQHPLLPAPALGQSNLQHYPVRRQSASLVLPFPTHPMTNPLPHLHLSHMLILSLTAGSGVPLSLFHLPKEELLRRLAATPLVHHRRHPRSVSPFSPCPIPKHTVNTNIIITSLLPLWPR